ncbi:MAG: hypothetical protein QNJ70_10755 [Xenococcaceae cyanobacterium MO_207.B15]|nr:hypothetical protein [Xenococcaceae cyanobacterium MO_207.B15]
MKILWHKLLLKLTIWLVLEIVLNLMGIDNIVDYSEYIFTHNNTATASVDVCFTYIIA